MRRRGAASIAANPVLIGAATILVAIVAVFLAYNANNGLPFVPTYQLDVRVPNAASLVKGNEVRIGGNRVGFVETITPLRLPGDRYAAELRLKLQTKVDPLPDDSTVIIRPRSVLGLKYVEINRGTSARGFPEGATVPLANANPRPVELDEFLEMFDEPTRRASQQNLSEFGNALAGRGGSLNVFVNQLDPLLTSLGPVMRNLASGQTDLDGFIRAIAATNRQVAPVGREQGELFTNLATTFDAFADVSDDLQESISEGPEALDAGIENFPFQRRFLRNQEGLFAELRPGVRALRDAAPALADAVTVGTPVLRRSVALNERLETTFATIEEFVEDPRVLFGLRSTGANARAAAGPASELRPFQTVCNYITLLGRNGSSAVSGTDGVGTWQRTATVLPVDGPNSEGAPAAAPANGGGIDENAERKNFLHSNPLPNTPGGGRTNECEAGNERYELGRAVVGNQPGAQGAVTERTVRRKVR